jgi:hypothetical protein
MTDPDSPDDALVLAFVEGGLDADARAAFVARLQVDAALRAEVDGLVALRGLIVDDARWGQTTGTDAPPPHLLDAIVHAEVAARPDAIRAAARAGSRGADDSDGPRPWWSRAASWLVGGSAVAAGALALLVAVRHAETPPTPAAAVATTSVEASADALTGGGRPHGAARRDEEGTRLAEAALQGAAPLAVRPAPTPAGAVAPGTTMATGGAATIAPPVADPARIAGGLAAQEFEARKPAALQAAPNAAAVAPAAARQASAAARPAAKEEAAAAATDRAAAPARESSPSPAGRGVDAWGAPDEAADVAPAAAPAAASAAAPADAAGRPSGAGARASMPPAPAIPRTREEFLARKAVVDHESKAKRAIADSFERARSVQTANEIQAAGERELSLGRAASALELAQRAETIDREGVLGALPLALQVRALAALHRPADAARVATRLLQAPPSEPLVVDALLVGADAAVAVGDAALARRLLLRALEPANRDAARRATARSRLERLDADRVRAPAASSPGR